MKKKSEYLAGIDEAGRGPIAGPVSVGVVLIEQKHQKKIRKAFPHFKDSKGYSAKQRADIFERINFLKECGLLDYRVCMTSPDVIDRKGIVPAIRAALGRGLSKVDRPKQDKEATRVLLDGGLIAPKKYIHQKTIIKGDEKELVIALASIVAKVCRDKKMIRYAQRYPYYFFEKNKGYGTRAHYEAIKKYGFCAIHRRSFLRVLTKT